MLIKSFNNKLFWEDENEKPIKLYLSMSGNMPFVW